MSRKHDRGLVFQGTIWVQGLLYFVLYTKQIWLMYKALCKPNYICFNQINLQTICLPYFSFISRFCYLKGYNFLPILSYLRLHVCIRPTVMYKKDTILGLKIFWLIVYIWNLSFYLCVYVSLHTQSCPTLCNSLNCSLPGSSVYGILQQEYWGGLPFPSLEDLPDLRIEPTSLASPALADGFFTRWATWEAHVGLKM